MSPPVIHTNPIKFQPTYATTNADGNIGNGVYNGNYWVLGRTLTVQLRLRVGGTTALGTGAIAVPLPPGFTTEMLDEFAMVTTDAFDVRAPAVGVVVKAGVVTSGCGDIHLNTFGPQSIVFSHLLAQFAGAIAGDTFTLQFTVPLHEHAIPQQ